MGNKKIKVCRNCGNPHPELSTRKLCPVCRQKIIEECITDLREKRGLFYYRWLLGYRDWLDKQLSIMASQLVEFTQNYRMEKNSEGGKIGDEEGERHSEQ